MTNENNEQKDFLEGVLHTGTPGRNIMHTSLISQRSQEMYNCPITLTSRCKAAADELHNVKPANPDFDGGVYGDLLFGDRQMLAASIPHKFLGDLDIMNSYWSPAFDSLMVFKPYNVFSDQWVEQDRMESSEEYDLENMPRFFSRRLYDISHLKHLEAIHDFYRGADDDHFEHEQCESELQFKMRLLNMKHLNATMRYGVSGRIDNSPSCWMFPPINVPMGNIEIIVSALRNERMVCRYNPVKIALFESERRDLGCFDGLASATKIERFVLDYLKTANRH